MAKTTFPEISTLKDSLSDLKEKLMDLEERMEDKVIKNPKKSMLIAFGAGMLAGVIAYALTRRRK